MKPATRTRPNPDRIGIFSACFAQVLTLINCALREDTTMSVTVSKRGFTVRIAGFVIVRNCPPEELKQCLDSGIAKTLAKP
jgi:hypothetical protein